MKILPISNCDDCPHYRWIELNYSLECGLTYEQIRYKEVGVDKALVKLFNQCPLQEYSMNEQQEIIYRDEISIKTMMSNMKKLEKENEQLQKQITEYNLILKQYEFAEKEGFK